MNEKDKLKGSGSRRVEPGRAIPSKPTLSKNAGKAIRKMEIAFAILKVEDNNWAWNTIKQELNDNQLKLNAIAEVIVKEYKEEGYFSEYTNEINDIIKEKTER